MLSLLRILFIFNICFGVPSLSCSEIPRIGFDELLCEYIQNPINLHTPEPRLSWKLQSEVRNQTQKAYQVLVASNEKLLADNLGDLWNSGKVSSNQSVNIVYSGKKLDSRMICHWKVRVWDNLDRPSDWSKPASWSMGLILNSDWKATWIQANNLEPIQTKILEQWYTKTAVKDLQDSLLRILKPATYLRKEFMIKELPQRARCYIAALGYYELYLNGIKIGDHLLDPAQTDYEKRALYVTYEVTEWLSEGENTIGIILGEGWYGQSVGFSSHLKFGEVAVKTQLEIFYPDGSQDTFITDDSWKFGYGPIIKNNIYAGEVYDARKESDGWANAGFDDSEWGKTKIVAPPDLILEPQLMPPIKKIKTIQAVKLFHPQPDRWVFDMGQNFAGWVQLKIEAAAGTAIVLRYGEWADSLGNVDFSSTGNYATGVNQCDMYICKGEEEEIWEPRFTYHGFRYVELTGLTGSPRLDMIEGVVVRTAVQKAGDFYCSDELLNRIHETVLWTMESNLHGFPEDCPHRERCGWLGDAHVTVETSLYNFNMIQFWKKYINDMATATDSDGSIHNIAPGKRKGGKAVDWGVATILIPWYHYIYYDDLRIVRQHYPYMLRFMDYFHRESKKWIVESGLGDWCDPVDFVGQPRKGGRGRPQHTEPAVTSTAYFYQAATIMSKFGSLLKEEEDAQRFRRWADSIKEAFNEKFFDLNSKNYGSQTANSIALYLGLVPVEREKDIARRLANDVIKNRNGHFTTGSHGNTRLYWALSEYGYQETAYNIFHVEGFPGFRYLFSLGGTTLWERAGSFDPAKEIAPDRSLNHPFHGGFDAWFYNGIGGINPDFQNPGFKSIILKPILLNQLEFANISYYSIYGEIISAWKKDKNTFSWKVKVPVNTTALLYFPTEYVTSLKENGRSIDKKDIIKIVSIKQNSLILCLGSGLYEFTSKLF